jgi:hypothetical protein
VREERRMTCSHEKYHGDFLMGFEPSTRIFSRVLNPKKFKVTSKRLALFHMKQAPFSSLNFKPGYLEHTKSDF